MIVHPGFANLPGVRAAMSLRIGGASPAPLCMNLSYAVGDAKENVDRNRAAFSASVGIPLSGLAIPGQVHGTGIQRIEAPGTFPDRDGLITAKEGVFLVVSIADCVPVLLVDSVLRIAAAIHAGWRGTAGGILRMGIDRCVKDFGTSPADLQVWLGPAAGPCCYGVSHDAASHFSSRYVHTDNGVAFLDLKQANCEQLLEAGVPAKNIEIHPDCTIHNRDYHSFRRDGQKSGRMMAVVGFDPLL